MSLPQSRTLRRALEILGSEDRLCATLRITPDELTAYLAGSRPMPCQVFLAALDIVAGGASHSG
jgi:hypothetical protein